MLTVPAWGLWTDTAAGLVPPSISPHPCVCRQLSIADSFRSAAATSKPLRQSAGHSSSSSSNAGNVDQLIAQPGVGMAEQLLTIAPGEAGQRDQTKLLTGAWPGWGQIKLQGRRRCALLATSLALLPVHQLADLCRRNQTMSWWHAAPCQLSDTSCCSFLKACTSTKSS